MRAYFRIPAFFVIAIAILFLIDWFFGARLQNALLGTLPRSLPLTLLLHAILAAAYLLPLTGRQGVVSDVLCLFVAAVALLALVENGDGIFYQFDALVAAQKKLLADIIALPPARHPGLPSLQTCIGILIMALLRFTKRKFSVHSWQYVTHLLAALLVPYSALCGYAFHALPIYITPGEKFSLSGISPITIALFFLNYSVLFLKNPENRLFRAYFGGRHWCRILRSFQDISILFPLGVGIINSLVFPGQGYFFVIALAATALPFIVAVFNLYVASVFMARDLEGERAVRELEASLTLHKQLDSLIAHDLRSPFNGILGLTQVLANPATLPERVHEYATILNAEAAKFFELLNDLLRWSHRKKSSLMLEFTDFSPIALFQSLEETYRAELTRKNLGFELECPENFRIRGDWQLTHAILRNFLSNAIKYSVNGEKIIFEVKKNAQNALLVVKDSGSSAEPAEIVQLLSGEDKPSQPGTMGESGFGLGLRICREFAEQLHGKISVASVSGKGTRFVFLTPLNQQQALREAALATIPVV